VSALPDSVSLGDPATELVVELVERPDPELVDEQAARVRRRAPDPWVYDLSLQIEVPVK
jgi:hypothetical protein